MNCLKMIKCTEHSGLILILCKGKRCIFADVGNQVFVYGCADLVIEIFLLCHDTATKHDDFWIEFNIDRLIIAKLK